MTASDGTALRLGAKTRDYWWTVLFTDPLALPIVSICARRRVNPDLVSFVALILGLGVGPLFALGTRSGLIAGALVFYAAFVADCIDGKLARALGVTTRRGAALDRLSDGGRRASASLGLIAWLWQSNDAGDGRVWWGIVYAVLAYYFLEISGKETALDKTTAPVAQPEQSSRGWAAALARRRLLPTPGMPDVQAVAFILGPLTGFVGIGLAVGIAMLVMGILISAWRRLR